MKLTQITCNVHAQHNQSPHALNKNYIPLIALGLALGAQGFVLGVQGSMLGVRGVALGVRGVALDVRRYADTNMLVFPKQNLFCVAVEYRLYNSLVVGFSTNAKQKQSMREYSLYLYFTWSSSK